MANIGYILKDDYDLKIENGDFAKGETLLTETEIILQLNQGELTSDPLLGPSLIRLIRDGKNNSEFIRAARLHLERDGKNYDELRDYIKLQG